MKNGPLEPGEAQHGDGMGMKMGDGVDEIRLQSLALVKMGLGVWRLALGFCCRTRRV